MRLRIGDVTFDGNRRCLVRDSETLHVSPKAFQLLELLLERRPDAVSKTEIMEAIWSGSFVTEGNLASLVNEIRDTLGDSARKPRFLRTVFGFGYAFDGKVSEVPDPAAKNPAHALRWGTRVFELREGGNLIGRAENAEVFVAHSSVSREHARIRVHGGEAEIEDLGSKNGTWCHGQKVSDPVGLRDRDEIRVGTVMLRYRSPLSAGPAEITETVP